MSSQQRRKRRKGVRMCVGCFQFVLHVLLLRYEPMNDSNGTKVGFHFE